jgi:hypothetical protein
VPADAGDGVLPARKVVCSFDEDAAVGIDTESETAHASNPSNTISYSSWYAVDFDVCGVDSLPSNKFVALDYEDAVADVDDDGSGGVVHTFGNAFQHPRTSDASTDDVGAVEDGGDFGEDVLVVVVEEVACREDEWTGCRIQKDHMCLQTSFGWDTKILRL